MIKKLTILAGTIIFALVIIFWENIIGDYKLKTRTLGNVIKNFSFSGQSSLKDWEEKVLKGKVVYTVVKDPEHDGYVLAESKNAASALYHKVKIDINRKPFINWKWRVNEFPGKSGPESISSKKDEDFAARIYVIFPAAFFTSSKAIEYIWAEKLPEGESGPSAYSNNIRVLVVRSGPHDGWVSERRDVWDDYVKLFGGEPRLDIGAIAFMTDADSTRTEASAQYDEINIGYNDTEVANAF